MKMCCGSTLKKVLWALCCLLTLAVLIIVPIYLFIMLPAQLMATVKDEINFWPCSVAPCMDAPDADNICTTCDAAASGFPACALTGVAVRALDPSLNLVGFQASIKIYNPISLALTLKQAALVLIPETGESLSASPTVTTAAEYINGGSLLACVKAGYAEVELTGGSWTAVDFHCEASATTRLGPLLTAFSTGGDLPASTTFSAVADTPAGEQSLSGTYSSSPPSSPAAPSAPSAAPSGPAPDSLAAQAGCPALTPINYGLESTGVSGSQCSMSGSTLFQTTLSGCAPSATLDDSVLSTFLCCLVKTLDGIGLMTSLLAVVAGR